MTPRDADRLLLSLVVPCYNEQAVIERTHAEIVSSLGSLPGVSLEIVYVDDGSQDRTIEILTALTAADPRVRVVCLSRNFGHQAAVTAGIDHARGDAVAVLDADLQDPPGVVAQMLQAWRQGYDVVYAVRTKRKESPWKRLGYAAFYRLLTRLAQIDIPGDSGDFSLLDRAVVDHMKALPERNRFVRGLRAWVGFRQTGVVYERQARQAGQTHYPFRKLLRLALDGLFNFSTLPLTVVFALGILVSSLSVLAVLGLLFFKLSGMAVMGHTAESLPGYTSVVLAIFFFGGVQLAALGIIGEYVGRIYLEVKGRPTYLVRAVVRQGTARAPESEASGG